MVLTARSTSRKRTLEEYRMDSLGGQIKELVLDDLVLKKCPRKKRRKKTNLLTKHDVSPPIISNVLITRSCVCLSVLWKGEFQGGFSSLVACLIILYFL